MALPSGCPCHRAAPHTVALQALRIPLLPARSSRRTVALPPGFTEAAAAPGTAPISYYASSGVQKAVLLARYTDLLQTW